MKKTVLALLFLGSLSLCWSQSPGAELSLDQPDWIQNLVRLDESAISATEISKLQELAKHSVAAGNQQLGERYSLGADFIQTYLQVKSIPNGSAPFSYRRYLLGCCLLERGQTKSAQHLFDEASRDKGLATVFRYRATCKSAEVDLAAGANGSAQTKLNGVLVVAPEQPDAVKLKARLKSKSGQANVAESSKDYSWGFGKRDLILPNSPSR